MKDKEDLIIIEIWNGIFKDLEYKVLHIIGENKYENLDNFLKELLIQEQKTLVLNLFHDKVQGQILQERYKLLYYVTLLITNNDTIDNLSLRIPPEVSSTVAAILEEVKSQQAFYSKS